MTNIRDAALHCECKKIAYRQTKDGVVISLLIHPNDVPDALATAPLGTRYMAALVEIGDDEQPINRTSGAEPVQPQAVSAEAAPTMKGERSDSCSQHIHAGPHQADNPSPSGGDRRKWDELPYSQQAAIRCQEPAFIKWLDEHYGYVVPDADAAARVVRELCGVETRTNILPGTPAGDKWQRIDSDFMLHRFGAMT